MIADMFLFVFVSLLFNFFFFIIKKNIFIVKLSKTWLQYDDKKLLKIVRSFITEEMKNCEQENQKHHLLFRHLGSHIVQYAQEVSKHIISE